MYKKKLQAIRAVYLFISRKIVNIHKIIHYISYYVAIISFQTYDIKLKNKNIYKTIDNSALI